MEVEVKERFEKKLMRSRLAKPGHVERMGDEKFAKRGEAQNVQVKRRRGRRKLRRGLH